jgi:hypothetical protein
LFTEGVTEAEFFIVPIGATRRLPPRSNAP